MREGVLFEITKDQLETGLRGVPVGYCVTSHVDPIKGLTYVGRPIAELRGKSPIEVIYLLYYGETGSAEQVAAFGEELKKRAACKEETIRHIEALPRMGDPMDLFAAALLVAGMVEETGDYREDCLNVIAKLPHIVAACMNAHAGWGETPRPDGSAGYMESFLQMLRAPVAKTEELKQTLRLFNILHFDHCGGNLSTFVGKAVASGLEGMYGSLAAAMTALAGPRHGGANRDCLEFIQAVMKETGEAATEADVERLLRQKVAAKELIFGFGHAVLRVEDPRATVLYQYAERHFPHDPLIRIALHLRRCGPRVLKENPKISSPYPNVDAISGALLMAAGFPFPAYYTLLFGLSRCVGIAIQIVYERCEAKGGKGTPIIRPLYLYAPRSSQKAGRSR
jgi:citrate synthase